jgi:hypothetical protein
MFLTILLLLSPAPLPASLDPGLDDQLSLEELLERCRTERDRVLETYRDQVRVLVTDMESAFDGKASTRKGTLAKCRKQLTALTPEALPLLVGYIEPGTTPGGAAKGRAHQVARVMAELPSTRPVTGKLLELLAKGSSEARTNALLVLGSSDDLERIGPVIRDLYTRGATTEKRELLGTIARLGGPENDSFVAAILADEDPRIIDLALAALAEARILSGAPRIMELLKTTIATAHIEGIVAYYRACPEVMDSEHCESLTELAGALVSRPDDAVKVLTLLTEFEDRWNSRIKREFRRLTDSPEREIARAALIGLARTGDRGSKKKLLDSYDDSIKRNPFLAQAWEQRAELNYLIGDYKNAIKDFQQAIKTGQQYGRSQPEMFVGLARSYMQLDKLKDAAAALEDAPLSILKLRKLAEEPVFAKLVKHPKYGKVFHLEDD